MASDTGSYIDIAGYLNDVKLAETLLENGKQNGGGVSFPRTGEAYPGFDVCKLCSFLVFRRPKEKK